MILAVCGYIMNWVQSGTKDREVNLQTSSFNFYLFYFSWADWDTEAGNFHEKNVRKPLLARFSVNLTKDLFRVCVLKYLCNHSDPCFCSQRYLY